MDPTTLATTATALLAPLLGKALGKAAEKIGEALPAQAGKVWTSITDKFKGKPAAEEAAKDLTAQPDDADRQAAFRLQLKKVLEQDPAFAGELDRLLAAASEGASGIVNIGSGAVATHGGVAAGAGGVAVGGNVGGSIVTGQTTIYYHGAAPGESASVQFSPLAQQLYGLLKGKWFSLSELQDLCFTLDVDWDKLGGDNKTDKARALVLECERSDRLEPLRRLMRLARPHLKNQLD